MHFNDKATRLERKKIFHSTNLSWIHDDALALHQSVSPATTYKRLQASAASWYQIPLQMLVPGNEIKHMLELSKILETALYDNAHFPSILGYSRFKEQFPRQSLLFGICEKWAIRIYEGVDKDIIISLQE